MRLSTAKDKVLKSLVSNDHKTYGNLNIPRFTKHAALVSLRDGGYIKIIETSVTGSGNIRTFEPAGVEPIGAHFVESKQSFRNKEIIQWWIDAPKNFWIIGTIFGLLTANTALIIGLLSKDKSAKPQIELKVKHGIKSDTIIVIQK